MSSSLMKQVQLNDVQLKRGILSKSKIYNIGLYWSTILMVLIRCQKYAK